MKKVTFIKEKKNRKNWSQTLNPSPSMAASFIFHFIINLFLRNLLMSRVTVCYKLIASYLSRFYNWSMHFQIYLNCHFLLLCAASAYKNILPYFAVLLQIGGGQGVW